MIRTYVEIGGEAYFSEIEFLIRTDQSEEYPTINERAWFWADIQQISIKFCPGIFDLSKNFPNSRTFILKVVHNFVW